MNAFNVWSVADLGDNAALETLLARMPASVNVPGWSYVRGQRRGIVAAVAGHGEDASGFGVRVTIASGSRSVPAPVLLYAAAKGHAACAEAALRCGADATARIRVAPPEGNDRDPPRYATAADLARAAGALRLADVLDRAAHEQRHPTAALETREESNRRVLICSEESEAAALVQLSSDPFCRLRVDWRGIPHCLPIKSRKTLSVPRLASFSTLVKLLMADRGLARPPCDSPAAGPEMPADGEGGTSSMVPLDVAAWTSRFSVGFEINRVEIREIQSRLGHLHCGLPRHPPKLWTPPSDIDDSSSDDDNKVGGDQARSSDQTDVASSSVVMTLRPATIAYLLQLRRPNPARCVVRPITTEASLSMAPVATSSTDSVPRASPSLESDTSVATPATLTRGSPSLQAAFASIQKSLPLASDVHTSTRASAAADRIRALKLLVAEHERAMPAGHAAEGGANHPQAAPRKKTLSRDELRALEARIYDRGVSKQRQRHQLAVANCEDAWNHLWRRKTPADE